MHAQKLLRVSGKILAYLSEQAQMKVTETIEDAFPLLESVATLFPGHVTMICPVQHSGVRFVSKNCKRIFGYDPDYLKNHLSMERFYQLIHPDDAEELSACFSFFDSVLQDQLPEDQLRIRVVFQYRILHPNGHYTTVQDEKGILSLPGANNIYYAIFEDITHEGFFGGVQASVYRLDEGLTKIAAFRPSAARKKLSKREQDIVSLIRNGLTNKEIAYRLNISQNTSRNIRSKLFEKFRVNNVIELLNVAV